MLIAVLGINHKSAQLPLRERIAKVCKRRFSDAPFVILSTCNRTEIYFSAPDLAEMHSLLLRKLRGEIEEEFEHCLYSYFGFDCFLHLARVASGMDSAILAETEIQGQVKAAYAASSGLPKELHYLFQKSLKIAKEARSIFPLSRGVPSLEEAIVQVIGWHASLQDSLLFIGASSINYKLFRYLSKKGMCSITFCNRTEEHLEGLDCEKLAWGERRKWTEFPIVICGTKSSDYILREEDVCQEACKQQLLIDLSVPRNVDPLIATFPHVNLLNMDQINQVVAKGRLSHLGIVEKMDIFIHSSVELHQALFLQRQNALSSFCIPKQLEELEFRLRQSPGLGRS